LPALAAYFIEQAARRFGRSAPRLTARAIKTLEAYGLPGNVRELHHVIERAVLLSASDVLRFDAVLSESDNPTRVDSGLAAREAAQAVIPESEWRRRERQNLTAALQLAKGRIYGPGGAAELLGVRPTTLISRLKALKLRETQRHPRSQTNRRSK
jgi:transcriptional regulator with GAF, ATPase, and Fis domain